MNSGAQDNYRHFAEKNEGLNQRKSAAFQRLFLDIIRAKTVKKINSSLKRFNRPSGRK